MKLSLAQLSSACSTLCLILTSVGIHLYSITASPCTWGTRVLPFLSWIISRLALRRVGMSWYLASPIHTRDNWYLCTFCQLTIQCCSWRPWVLIRTWLLLPFLPVLSVCYSETPLYLLTIELGYSGFLSGIVFSRMTLYVKCNSCRLTISDILIEGKFSQFWPIQWTISNLGHRTEPLFCWILLYPERHLYNLRDPC